jgi:hypothetical protein
LDRLEIAAIDLDLFNGGVAKMSIIGKTQWVVPFGNKICAWRRPMEESDRCRKRLSWGIGWYVHTEAHHVAPRYVSITQ